MESFIAVIVFFIISSFSFFIGTLMWKNRYNEKLKKILKSSQKELEFYENNIKIIHKQEKLKIPLEGLTILTGNAFVEDGYLYPTPEVAKNQVIVIQISLNYEVYRYKYVYLKRYEQTFKPARVESQVKLLN